MGLIKYQARQGRPEFLDTFFDDFFTRDRFFNDLIHGKHTVPANILESEEGFTVELSAPGFEKGDFTVEVNKGVMKVKGTHRSSRGEKGNADSAANESAEGTHRYTLREFTAHSFERSFKLPDIIDDERIEASYTNGVLRLLLPRRNEHIHPVKKIEIK